jgi:nitric oxide dioxygenase
VTPHQIDLVQQSFVHVVPIPDKVAAHFYERLFRLAPQVRPLFKNDMKAQGRKLVLTLATVVDGLDRLDSILPVARELAIRHVGYGVQAAHYDFVGAALIDTLRELLGPLFDGETEAAWAEAYQIVAGAMIEAGRSAA